MTRRRRITIAAAGILGLFAAYEIITSLLAYTADAYVLSDLISLAPEVTGRITAVHVADNQQVTRGDLLATIDPVPFELVVDQHQAELKEAGAQIAADQSVIGAAQDTETAATSAASYARETQARVAALATTQDMSRADLDAADNALRRADADLDVARVAIARAQAIMTMHQAAQVRAAAELATAQWQLSRTRLVAPADGTVTSLTLRVGDTAQANVPLIGIVDAHAWRIVANYKQSYIRQFTPGATAWVWLDSERWHLHRARIAGVARGISREPAPGRLLAYVAPTTDWIRLQRRFRRRI
jgi:membrane fusion protein, multidrug efflux system